ALVISACATSEGTVEDKTSHARWAEHRSSGFEVREASEAPDGDGMQVRLDHGFISQEAAQEAVMRRGPELQLCYRQAGPAMSFASGAVTLRFFVEADGAASDVRV